MLSGHGEIRVCLSRLTEGAKPRVDTAWRSEESWGWTQTFWSHCTEDTEATGPRHLRQGDGSQRGRASGADVESRKAQERALIRK